MSNAKVPSQRPRAIASHGAPASPPFATVEVDDSPTRRETLDIEAMIRQGADGPRSAGVPQLGSPTIPEVSRVTTSPTVPSTYVRPKPMAATEPVVPRTTMPATIFDYESIVPEEGPPIPVVSHQEPVPRAPFAPQIMAASQPAVHGFGPAPMLPAQAPLAAASARVPTPAPPSATTPATPSPSQPQGAAFASPPRSQNPSLPSPWTKGAPAPTPTPPSAAAAVAPAPARSFASPAASRPASPAARPPAFDAEPATPPGARLLPYMVAGSCFLLGVVATVLLANRLSAGAGPASGAVSAVVEAKPAPSEAPAAVLTAPPEPVASAPVAVASGEPLVAPAPAPTPPPSAAAAPTAAAAAKPASPPPRPRPPAPPGTPKRVVPPDPF